MKTTIIQPKSITEKNWYNLGLLPLSTDPTCEMDFRKFLPSDKYRVYVNRVEFNPPVTNENLMKMGPRIQGSANLLLPDEPLDAIAYACTSCATNLGDACIIGALTAHHGNIPAVNPAMAGRAALAALQAQRVALITPYIEEVADSVAGYFEDDGFTLTASVGMNCDSDYEISRVSAETIIETAVNSVTSDTDAIFLSCAAFRACDVIEEIEKQTGIPTVSSNSAMMYLMLKELGQKDRLQLGRLFDKL